MSNFTSKEFDHLVYFWIQKFHQTRVAISCNHHKQIQRDKTVNKCLVDL